MKKKNNSLFLIFIEIAIAILIALFLRTFVFNPVEIVGISMQPTYHEGDYLWQTSLVKPKRFDIITFPSPRDGEHILKRLIGLPGDVIQMTNDQLYINGKPYAEPYLTKEKTALQDNKPLTADFTLATVTKATVVPKGYYFVLGDNRRKADDSRYFGFVDAKSVIGVVFFRYYPLDRIGIQ